MNPFLAGVLAALLMPGLALAGDRAPVRFEDALFPKFQHERCLNCHQFNSRRSNGRAWNSHRNRYVCDGCHKPVLTGLEPWEWRAPEGGRMDYTGLPPREVCLLIKRNLGHVNVAERMVEHLLYDGRVRWALESGRRPDGKAATVPGGYAAWARDVRAWAADGLRCD